MAAETASGNWWMLLWRNAVCFRPVFPRPVHCPGRGDPVDRPPTTCKELQSRGPANLFLSTAPERAGPVNKSGKKKKKNTARRRAADDRQGVRRDSVGGEMQAVCTAVNGRVGSRRVNWVMGLGRLGLLESARQMHALHRSQDGVRSMQARSRLGRDASGRGGQRHVETT